MTARRTVLVFAVSALAACPEPPAAPVDPSVDEAALYPNGCDPIVADACGYPFPSDVWTVRDPKTATGLHLELPPAMFDAANAEERTDTRRLRVHDGFSANGAFMTYMAGATSAGLPDSAHIERSLEADSPTIVIDTSTGERVPHWAELDVHSFAPDSTGVISIQPAARLRDATRYVIALRNVVDANGEPLPITRAFRALRDGTALQDPRASARRPAYARITQTLRDAGVDLTSVQVAWEATTASEKTSHERLLHMRDSAFAALAEAPAPYEIDVMTLDVDDDIAVHIEGRVTVPYYLDETGFMVLDDASMPVVQREDGARFVLEIPYSASERACPVLQFGHAGYGTVQGLANELRSTAEDACLVLFGMEWLGYRRADVNLPNFAFSTGDLSRFRIVMDLNQQAVLSHMVGLRTVLRGISSDSRTFIEGEATISPSGAMYFGTSEGGILGITYVALSPDIERVAVTGVGDVYSLMAQRSQSYRFFTAFWGGSDFSVVQYPLLLGFLQLMWDRVDPASYAHRVMTNRFPGTRPKDVLVLNAIGDRTAHSLTGQHLARNLGIPLVTPANRSAYAFVERAAPFSGSGLLEVITGPYEEPVTNVPAIADPDPHLLAWRAPAPRALLTQFLLDGIIGAVCDGPCDPN